MVMNICARRWRHPRRSGHEHFLEQVNCITILKSRLYGYQHFLEQVNLAEQLNSSDFGISTGLIIKIIGKIANGIVRMVVSLMFLLLITRTFLLLK